METLGHWTHVIRSTTWYVNQAACTKISIKAIYERTHLNCYIPSPTKWKWSSGSVYGLPPHTVHLKAASLGSTYPSALRERLEGLHLNRISIRMKTTTSQEKKKKKRMKTTRAEEVQNPEVLHRKVRVEKCQAYWNGAKDSIHKMLIGKREGREGVGQKGKGAQENVCFPQPPPPP